MADATDNPAAGSVPQLSKPESTTCSVATATANNEKAEDTKQDGEHEHEQERKRKRNDNGQKSGRGGKRRDLGRKEWQYVPWLCSQQSLATLPGHVLLQYQLT